MVVWLCGCVVCQTKFLSVAPELFEQAAVKGFRLEGASLLEDPERDSCVLARATPLELCRCQLQLKERPSFGNQSYGADNAHGPSSQWICIRRLSLPARPFLLSTSLPTPKVEDYMYAAQWEWKMEALKGGPQSFDGSMHWRLCIGQPNVGSLDVVHFENSVEQTSLVSNPSSSSSVVAEKVVQSSSWTENIVAQGTTSLLLAVDPEHLDRDTESKVQLVKSQFVRKCRVLLDREKVRRIASGSYSCGDT